jgi:hypothetical protein
MIKNKLEEDAPGLLLLAFWLLALGVWTWMGV